MSVTQTNKKQDITISKFVAYMNVSSRVISVLAVLKVIQSLTPSKRSEYPAGVTHRHAHESRFDGAAHLMLQGEASAVRVGPAFAASTRPEKSILTVLPLESGTVDEMTPKA
jgi:hypothetical protein